MDGGDVELREAQSSGDVHRGDHRLVSPARIRADGYGYAPACGSRPLASPSWFKVVNTIKKIRSTSSTSMKLIRLISGSSNRRRGRRFKGSPLRGEMLALIQRIDQLHRLFLHADDEPLHFAAQKAVRDQRGNRHGKPGG